MKKPTKHTRHKHYKELLAKGSIWLKIGFCIAFEKIWGIDVYDDNDNDNPGLKLYPELWKYRPQNYEPGKHFNLTQNDRIEILKEAIKLTKPKPKVK